MDTGQADEVAKYQAGDPPDGRRKHHFERCHDYMYRDIAKAEHVGSLRMLYQTGREIDHSPYVGVRVGEASHPGPSGGGSRATARRRAENGDEGENDFGDLASILKPMIAAMIKEGVDHAWTTLSDAAEALLRAPGAHGCRRSTRWRPSAQLHPRSKAAPKRVQLVVAGLRRLEWRLRQLARAPGFGKLHDKAASQMHDMLGACPWLAEIPYFEMEQWADFVADRVSQLELGNKFQGGWHGRVREPGDLLDPASREGGDGPANLGLRGCGHWHGHPPHPDLEGVRNTVDAALGPWRFHGSCALLASVSPCAS